MMENDNPLSSIVDNPEREHRSVGTVLLVLFLAICVVIGQQNYLLFHGVVEIGSIVVSLCIFALAWNACLRVENGFLIFLGVAQLVVAILHLFHALAYKGMGVFPDAGPNLPTQLWIAARYVEAGTFFLSPWFLARRVRPDALLGVGLFVAGLLLSSIFWWGIFPDCFVEPTGLTPFKKISEYIVCLLLAGALARLYRNRSLLAPSTFKLLAASLAFTAAAELFFTFYVNVYGLSNFAGHILKTVGVLLLFEAIVGSGIRQPFAVLYRELEQNRQELRRERDALQTALSEVRMLSGLLPICAHCKAIRDDQGEWTRLEEYVSERSEAEFSHGICPACLAKHYPEYSKS